MKRTWALILVVLLLLTNTGYAATTAPGLKLAVTKNQYFINDYRLHNSLLANPIVSAPDGRDYLPLTPDNLKLFGLSMTKDKFMVELQFIGKPGTIKYVPTTQRTIPTTATKSTKALKLDGNLWSKQLLEYKGIHYMPINSDIFSTFMVSCLREKGKVTLELLTNRKSIQVNADAIKKTLKPKDNVGDLEYVYNKNFIIIDYKNGNKYIGDLLAPTKRGYGYFQYDNGYESGMFEYYQWNYHLTGIGRFTNDKGITWSGPWFLGELDGEIERIDVDGRILNVTYVMGKLVGGEIETVEVDDFVVGDTYPEPLTMPLTSVGVGMMSEYVCRISVYDKDAKFIGQGSGVIIGESGIILTNDHVIDGGFYYFIDFEDTAIKEQGYFSYTVIARDPDRDLALLGEMLDRGSIAMRESDLIAKGTQIYTIGSPLGFLNTLSEGIVSASDRVLDGKKFIQITAPISAGSSGGALLDTFGNLLGLTTSKIRDGESINLAIPVSAIRSFLGNEKVQMGISLYLSFGYFEIGDKHCFTDMIYADYNEQTFLFYPAEYEDTELNALDATALADLEKRLVDVAQKYVAEFKVSKLKLVYHVPGKSMTLTLKDGKIETQPWEAWTK